MAQSVWRNNSHGLCQIFTGLFGIDSFLAPQYKGIDGSARKTALIQDTEYTLEKTYHIAPYLGTFGAYLMRQ